MTRELVRSQFNGNLATRVIFYNFFIFINIIFVIKREEKVMKYEKNRMTEGFLIKLAKCAVDTAMQSRSANPRLS